jgi:hypothetical protein
MTVALRDLPPGQHYRMPWRTKPGTEVGKLVMVSPNSALVYDCQHDGSEWEEHRCAAGTQVEPITEEEYHQLRNRSGDGTPRNRSAVESPVELVHRLCKEMVGKTRNEIVAAATALGVNESTAKTQYYAWRKKNA